MNKIDLEKSIKISLLYLGSIKLTAGHMFFENIFLWKICDLT